MEMPTFLHVSMLHYLKDRYSVCNFSLHSLKLALLTDLAKISTCHHQLDLNCAIAQSHQPKHLLMNDFLISVLWISVLLNFDRVLIYFKAVSK